MWRVVVATVALGLVAGAPGRAAADPVGVRLVVERGRGAEQCPDAGTFEAGVVLRLGFDPFVDAGVAARERVECRISAAGEGLRAVVRVVDTASGEVRGERVIDATQRDCRELAAAVELTLTMVIGQAGEAQVASSAAPPGRAVPGPAGGASPSSPAAPVSPAAEAPGRAVAVAGAGPGIQGAVASDRRGRGGAPAPAPRLSVGLGVGASAGLGPSVQGAGVVEVGVSRGATGIVVRGVLQGEGEQAAAGGTVSVDLLGAGLGLCHAWGAPALCLVAEADRVGARGEGLPAGRRAVSWRAGAGLRASWEVSVVGPWFLRADAELQLQIVGTRVLVGEREVWSSAPVAGRAGLFFGVRY